MATTSARLLEVVSGKRALLTVGTTNFDALIELLNQPTNARRLLTALTIRGFHVLDLQIGNTGRIKPDTLVSLASQHSPPIQVNVHTLVPSLQALIESSSFVISHAGAGSILESLRVHRPTLVVVNDRLMDNHQQELAQALTRKRFVYSALVNQTIEAIEQSIAVAQCPIPSNRTHTDTDTDSEDEDEDDSDEDDDSDGAAPQRWDYDLRRYPPPSHHAFIDVLNEEMVKLEK